MYIERVIQLLAMAVLIQLLAMAVFVMCVRVPSIKCRVVTPATAV